ncbi:MAG: CRISPR-associated primase-polymerase type A1 [Desulfococcaceae bacterium]
MSALPPRRPEIAGAGSPAGGPSPGNGGGEAVLNGRGGKTAGGEARRSREREAGRTARAGTPSGRPPEPPGGEPRLPPDADPEMDAAMAPFLEARAAERSLDHFLRLFAGRPDAFARQWADRDANRQGYRPVRRALTGADLRGHLDGTATLGIYLLDAESQVRAAALDADLVPALRDPKRSRTAAGRVRAELNFLAKRIRSLARERGISPVIEFSGGKGYHFWFLFSRPVPAADARRLLNGLAGAVSGDLSAFSLEVFPKQDRLSGKGLGNLLKLPLGVHRMSGRRSWFSECADRSVDAQLRWLAGVAAADPDRVDFSGSGFDDGGGGPPERARASLRAKGGAANRAGRGGAGKAPGPVSLSRPVYPPPEEAAEGAAGAVPGEKKAAGGDSVMASRWETGFGAAVRSTVGATAGATVGPTAGATAGAASPGPAMAESGGNGAASGGAGTAALDRLTAACPPLAAAVAECRSGRGLSESGERVLFQTLAFLPEGPELLHRLMAEVPDVAPREVEFRLGRVRGGPLGCRRIHALTGHRGDFCDFGAAEGYAHPLRHLEMAAPRQIHERAAELESALRTLKAAIAAVEGLLR